jgi:hypothetical protein
MELIIMGIFMCISFLLGRYTVKEIPIENPVKKVVKKVRKNNNDDFKLDEATITMLENIENYDGTGLGQKDVPEEV